jgi:ring-1,2-phenylacetyl-CoA epoxidase subunit PaaD
VVKAAGVLGEARNLLAQVVDPEIPVVTIADLGILRGVTLDADGTLEVTITPTYSGCPAVDQIEDDIRLALAPLVQQGTPVQVLRTLSPAWTTDWITPLGRQRMLEFGIAPPLNHDINHHLNQKEVVFDIKSIAIKKHFHSEKILDSSMKIKCPRCWSDNVTETSHFASTACKSLWRCLDCLEPFDHFKAH